MSLLKIIKHRLKNTFHHAESARQVGLFFEDRMTAPNSMTFTVGDEETNAIVVSCQLNDFFGDAVTERKVVQLLILADSSGNALNSSDYTVAAGTDGALAEAVSDGVIVAVTEADGDLDISLTLTGAGTCYLAYVRPDGGLDISGAITHAS